MNTEIKQIAERLKGLRDALELSEIEAATRCGISESEYHLYESGDTDIPMSFICRIAKVLGVTNTALISGEEPHALSYFVTRKGTGISVERYKAYKYKALTSGFLHPKTESFEVTVEPNELPIRLNTHPGEEFNFVLEGALQLSIAGKNIVLNEGDCIYFDSTKPHGMKALNQQKVRFLATII